MQGIMVAEQPWISACFEIHFTIKAQTNYANEIVVVFTIEKIVLTWNGLYSIHLINKHMLINLDAWCYFGM